MFWEKIKRLFSSYIVNDHIEIDLSANFIEVEVDGCPELLEVLECDHGVKFDQQEADKLTSDVEIRKKFPRFEGKCSACGFEGVAYASKMHYIYGNW